ncbi:Protein CBR-TAG-151 [Caenorhabditis briggsae]|uniref:Pre-rRNA-processing protein TSR1 homolog n=1 Tax=Caenorhabditis briggsae TaxID=6238 RepID=TSR1_CAEBR|nr:Protein CBR-TAG-151 [Caenorhabditis briggsae]Q61WR2.1 RecName: Full=Pre-rRNA-processing protein TSR1 homolog [Caenorhabditis briggsae]CAP25030.3 Protein CBR-TAG-151 [Caenorhabditis briggsae]
MSTTGHRAGVFKKPAKPHKSWKGKRTKGEITTENRGREGVKQLTRSAHSTHRAVSKDARRNQLKMARDRKMADAMERRRTSNAPCLVTILSLGVGARPSEFLKKLATCDETIVQTHSPSTIDFAIPRFKSRISFLTPDKENVDSVLDAIRASDVLCFLWPLSAELSEWDEQLLTICKAAGLPTIVSVVPGLGGIQNHKKKEDVRKGIEFTISKWSMSNAGVMPADSVTDNLQLLRTLNETKKKPLTLQARHSYMLVENLEATESPEDSSKITLKAQGYLRGPEWNANNLIHLPGFGDFQISKIETAADPHPLKTSPPKGAEVIAKADEKRQSLETEITLDAMDGEQTWPTQEELEEADKEMRRVPKGTSSYQAAWILDDSEDDEDEEDEDEDMDDEEEDKDLEEDDEEEDTPMDLKSEAGETTASEMMFHDEIDEDINLAEVEKYRKERENAQWPDEVDTPIDQPARIRFQKYRGLKSFRTSTWDAKENLPVDYARIFQFANYKNTKKNVMSKIGGNDVDAGDAVIDKKFNGVFASVYIENVPVSVMEAYKETKNLVLFQLLPHEQKMSILNMVLKKHPSCTVPIGSEDQKFIFYVGFRQFEAHAVLSSNTPGDKFKLERFMPTEKTFVATVYAPITFNPATVLCFRQDDKGRQELVATGSVLDTNPDRIVLKRTVLSGHPYKINRRAVVVRYMFFNREDIDWFKPVELYTPSGRRGHIKEAVGTHGHMKCRFDQQLNAQDSVMLNLYKRVFPVWDYSLFNRNLNPSRFVERSRVESISLVQEDAMEE